MKTPLLSAALIAAFALLSPADWLPSAQACGGYGAQMFERQDVRVGAEAILQARSLRRVRIVRVDEQHASAEVRYTHVVNRRRVRGVLRLHMTYYGTWVEAAPAPAAAAS